MARQIAEHPSDPYGFTQFWSARPVPALEVLAPPVLPYWLGLGIALAPSWGESEFGWVGLKLWMLPWHLLFVLALRRLVRAFVPGSPDWAVAAITLSAGVLPFWNLMLDLPAAALSLAALAAVASDHPSWRPHPRRRPAGRAGGPGEVFRPRRAPRAALVRPGEPRVRPLPHRRDASRRRRGGVGVLAGGALRRQPLPAGVAPRRAPTHRRGCNCCANSPSRGRTSATSAAWGGRGGCSACARPGRRSGPWPPWRA